MAFGTYKSTQGTLVASEIAEKRRQRYATDPEFRARVLTYISRYDKTVRGRQKQAELRAKPGAKEKQQAYEKQYYADPVNKARRLARRKQRLANDLPFKIACTLRWRLAAAIRRGKASKVAGTLALVGCTLEQLIEHLERQFLPGMTWQNHGRYGWHIDHKRPVASFDLTDLEQQKACFHYTNLQPLWAKDNFTKGDKLQYVAAGAGKSTPRAVGDNF